MCKTLIAYLFLGSFILLPSFLFSQDTSHVVTGRGGKVVVAIPDSSGEDKPLITADTLVNDTLALKKKKPRYDYTYHSPKKATWMSAALPSLGQFYNRRYWKPPIIYAALGVSLYFLIDNQVKFVEARNAYRARQEVPGYAVPAKYKNLSADQILANRDFYRNNRDYSIIAVAGVYLLNVIDAAVDAHLRTFDVSDDLSMRVRPSFQYTAVAMQNSQAPMPGVSWKILF